MDRKKIEEELRQKKNAELIVAQIREESGQEAGKILEDARQEAAAILQDASAEAERRRVQMLGQARQELEKMRERIFSGVNLEKKRIVLEEKNTFIRQVIASVSELAGQFRKEPGYDDFLRRAIAEGARVVAGASSGASGATSGREKAELEVAYAAPDEKLFLASSFILPLESLCRQTLKKTVTFRYTRGNFEEPGVIVSSIDGRIQFDNRFSSRLSRMEAHIYARLLKESL